MSISLTIFTTTAPLNSVIKALPRKPWEDPETGEDPETFTGQAGETRAAQNLRRFVEAHMIPVSPFEENVKIPTLGGRTIWWTTEDGVMKLQPDGIEVKEVISSVSNGQVWTITSVINY